MKTCCIFGHRVFDKTKDIEIKVKKTIIDLIEKENVTQFLFGSKSDFVDFCYSVVSGLKENYPFLIRVYVRAEYPIVNVNYCKYLKNLYEDTYFYNNKSITHKNDYIKRNQTMIEKSDICMFYFNKNYIPKTKTRSGTGIAYNYAVKKGKKIVNVF